MKSPTYLSKTKIMAGMQCPKNLFLQVYNKKLASPITAAEQMVFDQGNLVGELAQKKFTKKTALVNKKFWDFEGALKQTEEFIFQGKENIFEASFTYKGIFARVDILQKVEGDNDLWNLIEVKSGTKVKDENIKDVALQLWILENLDYKIQNCYLMHINNQCVFPDMSDFFHKEDITLKAKEVKNEVANSILELKQIVDNQKEPDIDIGPHCNTPYECKFKSYCGKHLPKDSVFLLPSMEEYDFKEDEWKKKLWGFYKQNIFKIKDIPVNKLTPRQQIAQKVHTQDKSYIDKNGIALDLKKLKQPFHYLSFNIINPAIPFWEGVRPYEQIIFQYSICMQKNFDSDLVYKNYLHDNNKDPRLALAEKLVKDAGDEGSVVCYHKAFDGHKIKSLAKLYPHLQKPLLNIVSRLVDPLLIFKKHVYLKSFGAQINIKFIATALFGKELGFDNLNIKDEALVQMAYKNLIKEFDNKNFETNKDKITQDLLEYGKQDVYILAKLTKWLCENTV
ncbi:MAG: DUF2779 domain-containing protein [Bdellovibrionales bacterium]|nr:DUF2779 domain-containing protein [Bdellovibrionales bacterium]